MAAPYYCYLYCSYIRRFCNNIQINNPQRPRRRSIIFDLVDFLMGTSSDITIRKDMPKSRAPKLHCCIPSKNKEFYIIDTSEGSAIARFRTIRIWGITFLREITLPLQRIENQQWPRTKKAAKPSQVTCSWLEFSKSKSKTNNKNGDCAELQNDTKIFICD